LDPVVSGAPGITPYRFGLNNPLLYSDPSGGFEVPVHKRMTMVVALMSQLSTAQSLALVLGVQNADYLGFAEDWHFDGRDDFEAVQRTWAEINGRMANRNSGDYYGLGVDLHTVQDFYAHSNYVELYVEYYRDSGKDMGSFTVTMIPLYQDGINDEAFRTNYLEPRLHTGEFSILKDFILEKTPENSNRHYNMNKDSEEPEHSPHGADVIQGTTITWHDAAATVAQTASAQAVLDKQAQNNDER
jgi:hypothetical protein